jgi:hypothetical protein
MSWIGHYIQRTQSDCGKNGSAHGAFTRLSFQIWLNQDSGSSSKRERSHWTSQNYPPGGALGRSNLLAKNAKLGEPECAVGSSFMQCSAHPADKGKAAFWPPGRSLGSLIKINSVFPKFYPSDARKRILQFNYP